MIAALAPIEEKNLLVDVVATATRSQKMGEKID